MESVKTFALTVLRDELNVNVDADVDDGTVLGPDGLGLDSLTLLELCTRFEDEYGIDVVDDFESILPMSFGEIVDFVATARAA